MMKRKNHKRLLFLVVSFLLLAVSVEAFGSEGSIPWDQLSPGEQKTLQPFADRWQELKPQQQQRLQKGASRWATLTPEQRQQVQKGLKRWKQMTPEQDRKSVV